MDITGAIHFMLIPVTQMDCYKLRCASTAQKNCAYLQGINTIL